MDSNLEEVDIMVSDIIDMAKENIGFLKQSICYWEAIEENVEEKVDRSLLGYFNKRRVFAEHRGRDTKEDEDETDFTPRSPLRNECLQTMKCQLETTHQVDGIICTPEDIQNIGVIQSSGSPQPTKDDKDGESDSTPGPSGQVEPTEDYQVQLGAVYQVDEAIGSHTGASTLEEFCGGEPHSPFPPEVSITISICLSDVRAGMPEDVCTGLEEDLERELSPGPSQHEECPDLFQVQLEVEQQALEMQVLMHPAQDGGHMIAEDIKFASSALSSGSSQPAEEDEDGESDLTPGPSGQVGHTEEYLVQLEVLHQVDETIWSPRGVSALEESCGGEPDSPSPPEISITISICLGDVRAGMPEDVCTGVEEILERELSPGPSQHEECPDPFQVQLEVEQRVVEVPDVMPSTQDDSHMTAENIKSSTLTLYSLSQPAKEDEEGESDTTPGPSGQDEPSEKYRVLLEAVHKVDEAIWSPTCVSTLEESCEAEPGSSPTEVSISVSICLSDVRAGVSEHVSTGLEEDLERELSPEPSQHEECPDLFQVQLEVEQQALEMQVLMHPAQDGGHMIAEDIKFASSALSSGSSQPAEEDEDSESDLTPGPSGQVGHTEEYLVQLEVLHQVDETIWSPRGVSALEESCGGEPGSPSPPEISITISICLGDVRAGMPEDVSIGVEEDLERELSPRPEEHIQKMYEHFFGQDLCNFTHVEETGMISQEFLEGIARDVIDEIDLCHISDEACCSQVCKKTLQGAASTIKSFFTGRAHTAEKKIPPAKIQEALASKKEGEALADKCVSFPGIKKKLWEPSFGRWQKNKVHPAPDTEPKNYSLPASYHQSSKDENHEKEEEVHKNYSQSSRVPEGLVLQRQTLLKRSLGELQKNKVHPAQDSVKIPKEVTAEGKYKGLEDRCAYLPKPRKTVCERCFGRLKKNKVHPATDLQSQNLPDSSHWSSYSEEKNETKEEEKVGKNDTEPFREPEGLSNEGRSEAIEEQCVPFPKTNKTLLKRFLGWWKKNKAHPATDSEPQTH